MIDTLIELWIAVLAGVGIGVLVDVVTFALKVLELVVNFEYTSSYVAKALSGGWAEIVVDVSIDRRVGEWVDALTCV